MKHTRILAMAAVLAAALSITSCEDSYVPRDTSYEPTTSAECKSKGGTWRARDCWWGEDAKSIKCRERDAPHGQYWDWDWERPGNCVLVTDEDT